MTFRLFAGVAAAGLVTGAILASCGSGTPSANAQPSPQTRQVQAVVWQGKYAARIPPGKGSMTITPIAGSPRYDVEIVASGFPSGCGGSAQGAASVSGSTMTLDITADWLDEGKCQMTITRTGGVLTVDNGTCRGLTGHSCTLEGNYTLVSGRAAPIVVPSASGSSWIFGKWAVKAEWCLGSAVLFNPDGTFVAEGMSGRWKLVGTVLAITVLMSDEDDDGEAERLAEPKIIIERIVSRDATSMTQRSSNGTLSKLVRCPA